MLQLIQLLALILFTRLNVNLSCCHLLMHFSVCLLLSRMLLADDLVMSINHHLRKISTNLRLLIAFLSRVQRLRLDVGLRLVINEIRWLVLPQFLRMMLQLVRLRNQRVEHSESLRWSWHGVLQGRADHGLGVQNGTFVLAFLSAVFGLDRGAGGCEVGFTHLVSGGVAFDGGVLDLCCDLRDEEDILVLESGEAAWRDQVGFWGEFPIAFLLALATVCRSDVDLGIGFLFLDESLTR